MRTAFPSILPDNLPETLLPVSLQLHLIQAAANLREAQRRYFKSVGGSSAQRSTALNAAKAAETVFDALLSDALRYVCEDQPAQQELF